MWRSPLSLRTRLLCPESCQAIQPPLAARASLSCSLCVSRSALCSPSNHHILAGPPLKYHPALPKPFAAVYHHYPASQAPNASGVHAASAAPYLNPSSAFMAMSKLMTPSSLVSGAVSLSVTSSELLPRRPREGEVSRAGAMHLDNFCPVVLVKKAANLVIRPLMAVSSPPVRSRWPSVGSGED